MRWLGTSARVVTFSCERTGPGGFRNSLLLTDVRARSSTPFREVSFRDVVARCASGILALWRSAASTRGPVASATRCCLRACSSTPFREASRHFSHAWSLQLGRHNLHGLPPRNHVEQ